MKLLSLIASRRRKGNSALVARLIEKYAPEYEITVYSEFLDDYNIVECDGCMRCVFRDIKCHLKDDFYKLIDRISEADMFVLIAPTYVFSIPGNLKSFLDRFLLFLSYYRRNYGKNGATVGIASLGDWEHLQLPFLNTLMLSLGFSVVDSFMLYGAGPGEILLDNSIEKKVGDMIHKLLNGIDIKDLLLSRECPVCHSRVFECEEGKFRCPFCRTRAVKKGDNYLFEYESIKNHRFTKDNIEEHFNGWILKTENTFRKNIREIVKKKKVLLGTKESKKGNGGRIL